MLLCGSHISSICVFARRSITCSTSPPIHKNCFSILSPHPINPFRLSPWGLPVPDVAFDDDSSFLCRTLCQADRCHRRCESSHQLFPPPQPPTSATVKNWLAVRPRPFHSLCKAAVWILSQNMWELYKTPGFVDVKLSVLGNHRAGKRGILMGSCHEHGTHMVLINERGGDQTKALTQNTWILANTNTRSHSQRLSKLECFIKTFQWKKQHILIKSWENHIFLSKALFGRD